MGVVGRIAAIAQEQYILTFGRLANGARGCFFLVLIRILSQPLLYIEFRHLLLVFDIVG